MNLRRQRTPLVLFLFGLACSDTGGSGGFADGRTSSGGGGSSGTPETSSSGGSSGSGFGPSAGGKLNIDPSNAVLFIDTATTPATPATQVYKVVRKEASGDVDVSGAATFVLDNATLGTFAGATFTSANTLPPGPPAVTSRVTVTAGDASNVANITLVPLRRSSDTRDFFFLEPYQAAPAPTSDVLKFRTNIQQVDVAFVMDTTASMGTAINALKAQLTGTLLAQLQAAIPSVQMAIVGHRDQGEPLFIQIAQTMTPTVAQAQSGISLLNPGGGGDIPEGQIPAMYHVLTGAVVTGVSAVTPPAGTFGAVQFRAGSVPVVVLISDADWHDPRAGVTMTALQTAFTNVSAKFVALTSPPSFLFGDNEAQANTLSDATASYLPPTAFMGCPANKCCTGINSAPRNPTGPGGTCRLNFKYDDLAPNIGKGVVDAIQAISVGSSYEVTARVSNDTSNPGGVDATKFIKALRAKDEGDPAQGCPARTAKDTNADGIKDTFDAVVVGTPVCFEVIPQTNTTVPPDFTAQFFSATIDILGLPGDVKLDKRRVTFLVPPKEVTTK